MLLTCKYAFVYGMINPEDIEKRLINCVQETIQSLLTCQLFLIKSNFKIDGYDVHLNQSLEPVFSDKSRFNVMKFNKLISDSNSFTLPNLFIEELVHPSKVDLDYYIDYPQEAYTFIGTNKKMREWLCEFYTTMAPTLCCILNPAYDFSDTFKMYMPKTYFAVTQKQSAVEGDVSITKKLNIQNIDEIMASAYMKQVSSANDKS